MVRGFIAAAVEAAVMGAGSARARHLLSESFSGAKDPYSGVVRRDTGGLGVVLDRYVIDLDAPQGVGVFGFQRIGEPSHARAGNACELLIVVAARFELGGKLLQAPIGGGLPPLVVDDRIAKNPIKPADRGLVDLAASREPADESVLQNLLGDRPIADPSLDVAQKLAMVFDQEADDLGADIGFFGCRLVSHATGT